MSTGFYKAPHFSWTLSLHQCVSSRREPAWLYASRRNHVCFLKQHTQCIYSNIYMYIQYIYILRKGFSCDGTLLQLQGLMWACVARPPSWPSHPRMECAAHCGRNDFYSHSCLFPARSGVYCSMFVSGKPHWIWSVSAARAKLWLWCRWWCTSPTYSRVGLRPRRRPADAPRRTRAIGVACCFHVWQLISPSESTRVGALTRNTAAEKLDKDVQQLEKSRRFDLGCVEADGCGLEPAHLSFILWYDLCQVYLLAAPNLKRIPMCKELCRPSVDTLVMEKWVRLKVLFVFFSFSAVVSGWLCLKFVLMLTSALCWIHVEGLHFKFIKWAF